MRESTQELRQEFVRTLIKTRQQHREIAEKVGTILDEWCATNGVTRAQLRARSEAAARAEADDDAL